MIRPPTIAPGTEVKPPRISTGSAFSATSEIENCTPSLLPHIIPATSPTTPATDQTMTQIERSGMPTDCAAWWSSATARSARPIVVRWKKRASAATSEPATAAATRSNFDVAVASRLEEIRQGVHWRRWGPYLSERQWGTVREVVHPVGQIPQRGPARQDRPENARPP